MPRDYIAAYNRLLAAKRVTPLQEMAARSNRELYLRRMARAQQKAVAAGQAFVPQKARGHAAGEHIPRRAKEAAKRAQERIWRLPYHEYEQASDHLRDLIEHDPERLQLIEKARRWAQKHPAQRKWGGPRGYKEVFHLADEDFNLFWPLLYSETGRERRRSTLRKAA